MARPQIANPSLSMTTKGFPGLHQLSALLEQITSPIGSLDRVRQRMRQRRFAYKVGSGRALGAPVLKCAPEAVRRDAGPDVSQ